MWVIRQAADYRQARSSVLPGASVHCDPASCQGVGKWAGRARGVAGGGSGDVAFKGMLLWVQPECHAECRDNQIMVFALIQP